MSIEAMKQALEIIKNMRSGYGDDYPTEKERKTITALRQAIEEAEKQQALDKKADNALELGLDYEPVAWLQEDRIVPEIGYDCTMTREHPKELGYTPLYTAPPRKEWVGLTDEEILSAAEEVPITCIRQRDYDLHFAPIIEAKLREKNGG